MGEYANYKGHEVKIGTCNSMYYLRWEQRKDVVPLPGNVNPVTQVHEIWFRPPRHSEDGIEPGMFDFHGWCGAEPIRFYIKDEKSRFAKEVRAIAEAAPGHAQVYHKEIGVLCNIPCCHGFTTELPKGMAYNGFSPHVLGISGLSVRNGEAVALIGCIACGKEFMILNLEELVRYCSPFGDEREDWERCLQTMMDIEASLWLEQDEVQRLMVAQLKGHSAGTC